LRGLDLDGDAEMGTGMIGSVQNDCMYTPEQKREEEGIKERQRREEQNSGVGEVVGIGIGDEN
jgi:hypothetical protein